MAENSGDKLPKQNYPGNSHKEREGGSEEVKERRKLDKVVSGEAKQKKKSLGSKIADTMKGDDAQSVGSYILFDVVIPAAKSMISDAVSQGIERMLFGGGTARSRGGSSKHTSYNRMYSGSTRSDLDRPSGGSPRSLSSTARSSHVFDEVIIETRGEAEEVLDRLNDCINQYDIATVSDLYDLIGITGSFTDDKWGWADLRSATIRRVRAGYSLELPKTQPID